MPCSLLAQLGDIHYLIWITLEADSETKIQMPVVHLGLGVMPGNMGGRQEPRKSPLSQSAAAFTVPRPTGKLWGVAFSH